MKMNSDISIYKITRKNKNFEIQVYYDQIDECWVWVIDQLDISSFWDTEKQALNETINALELFLDNKDSNYVLSKSLVHI